MKGKIELEWAEQLEDQRHQFTILQCEITVAAERKDHLIKVYICTDNLYCTKSIYPFMYDLYIHV